TFAFRLMLKSSDGGATWNNAAGNLGNYMGGQGWYDPTLAVDPSDPNVVFAAGSFSGFSNGNFIGGVVETRDGGSTWTDLAVGSDNKGPHVDFHASASAAPGHYLSGNDGGIWRLENPNPGAIRWSGINGNLQITQFT